jgi:hypothetical protein
MNERELLEELRREMILTEVRARGARFAWTHEVKRRAEMKTHEMDLVRGTRWLVRTKTNDGVQDLLYEYQCLQWDVSDDLWVAGHRVNKNGQVSKNSKWGPERMCRFEERGCLTRAPDEPRKGV